MTPALLPLGKRVGAWFFECHGRRLDAVGTRASVVSRSFSLISGGIRSSQRSIKLATSITVPAPIFPLRAGSRSQYTPFTRNKCRQVYIGEDTLFYKHLHTANSPTRTLINPCSDKQRHNVTLSAEKPPTTRAQDRQDWRTTPSLVDDAPKFQVKPSSRAPMNFGSYHKGFSSSRFYALRQAAVVCQTHTGRRTRAGPAAPASAERDEEHQRLIRAERRDR